jgi:hypothetical protein
MKKIVLAAAASLLAAVACSTNPAAPKNLDPGIHLLAGAGVSDTIDAVRPQAIIVQVIGPDGNPVPGTAVMFEATKFGEGTPQELPTMMVSGITQSDFTTSLGATTDSEGKASVRVRFGGRAGLGAVLVTAPVFGYEATASFDVLPGAAVQIAVFPSDTVIYRGKSYSLSANSMDRRGNVKSASVTYTVSSPSATVNGQVISGTGYGRVAVTGQLGSLRDTVFVTIVPEGVVAVYSDKAWPDSSGIVVFGLDGSEMKRLAPRGTAAADHMAPQWSPSGEEIVFTRGFRIDSDSGVGTQVVAGDISGNGYPDIVVGNKKGTFVFLNRPVEVTREEWEKAQPRVIMFHRN